MSKFEQKYFLNVIMTFNAIRFPIASFFRVRAGENDANLNLIFCRNYFPFRKVYHNFALPGPLTIKSR
jgi:hypothetical protein